MVANATIEVRLAEAGADDEPIGRGAEQEHRRDHDDCGEIGIDPAEAAERPGAVHGDHQELAMGEVDDARHAEDQRQPMLIRA
jgi:hypothetical protein